MVPQRVKTRLSTHTWLMHISCLMFFANDLLSEQAKSLQSCPTLCDPLDYRPSGSSVHRIFQERTLEWVSMPSSRGSSRPRDWNLLFFSSCIEGRFFLPVSHLGSSNDLLLAVYFIFILDYGIDVRTIFLFQFKMGHESAETTSTVHLAQKLLMNVQCSGISRSSAKETRALKMRIIMAGHQKMTMTKWEQSPQLILL